MFTKTGRVPVCGVLNRIPWFNSHLLNPVIMGDFYGMELTMLGTASAGPSLYRNVSSYYLRMDGRYGPGYCRFFSKYPVLA